MSGSPWVVENNSQAPAGGKQPRDPVPRAKSCRWVPAACAGCAQQRRPLTHHPSFLPCGCRAGIWGDITALPRGRRQHTRVHAAENLFSLSEQMSGGLLAAPVWRAGPSDSSPLEDG